MQEHVHGVQDRWVEVIWHTLRILGKLNRSQMVGVKNSGLPLSDPLCLAMEQAPFLRLSVSNQLLWRRSYTDLSLYRRS